MKTEIEELKKEIEEIKKDLSTAKETTYWRLRRLEYPPDYKMGQKINDKTIICGEPELIKNFSERLMYSYDWKYNTVNIETGVTNSLWEYEIKEIMNK